MDIKFGDRSSQKYNEEIKDIDCPICGKIKIRVVYIAGYMSYRTSRISSGAKTTPFFHEPKIKVRSSCKECKASKEEIKEALERGGKRMSHEERLKRIKDSGLPTVIES